MIQNLLFQKLFLHYLSKKYYYFYLIENNNIFLIS